MSERDFIEPRACIMLRLEEIEAVLLLVNTWQKMRLGNRTDTTDALIGVATKLALMRSKLIEQAKKTVPAFAP